jgi:putative MFS transporter
LRPPLARPIIPTKAGGTPTLELLEQQTRLTGNQRKIVAAAVLGDMLDYFDCGLIAPAIGFS